MIKSRLYSKKKKKKNEFLCRSFNSVWPALSFIDQIISNFVHCFPFCKNIYIKIYIAIRYTFNDIICGRIYFSTIITFLLKDSRF